MSVCPAESFARCVDAPVRTLDLRSEQARDVATWCLDSMRSLLERQLPVGVASGVLRVYDAAARHVLFEVSTLYASEVGDEA